MNEQEKDARINAAKVAQIWNERARKEYGVNANYSRWSVRGRRADLEGQETALGWLYSEERARTIPLVPRVVKRPDTAARNRAWNKARKEKRVCGELPD